MSTKDGVRFPLLCRAAGLDEPVAEYRFALAIKRNWRFDWAWPAHRVALEIEGGAFTGGRHTRGAGFAKDIEKYNRAQLDGWTVLRCLPKQLSADATFEMLHEAMTTPRLEHA